MTPCSHTGCVRPARSRPVLVLRAWPSLKTQPPLPVLARVEADLRLCDMHEVPVRSAPWGLLSNEAWVRLWVDFHTRGLPLPERCATTVEFKSLIEVVPS